MPDTPNPQMDNIAYREEGLAPFASRPSESRGRLYPIAETPLRTPHQRDRDRVIHCATFRRLKHKTQVFVYHVGDYYRTRLTHSIEVAQIARSITRALRLNEDLAEALALAHDFGHTAFGHAGEEALQKAMAEWGGFDHNAQSLRAVTTLEQRYAAHSGLNLTWETLEGIAKHNGPLVDTPVDPQKPPDSLAFGIRAYLPLQDLEVHSFAGPEAQVAALSDDVAYINHDVEDGLRAGLFTLEEISEVPLFADRLQAVREKYPGLEGGVLVHETVRRVIDLMIRDILAESAGRIASLAPANVGEIRAADAPVIAFSSDTGAEVQELRKFLYARMYGHPRVIEMAGKGKKVVTDLFNRYMEHPDDLPDEWRALLEDVGAAPRARVISDFIAGMTDRFALQQYARFFDEIEIKL